MAASEGLKPPPEMGKTDPGAHQLSEPESSDSDDQFTDAQSGTATPHVTSPVPKPRAENVDSSSSPVKVPAAETKEKMDADAKSEEIAQQDDPETEIPTEVSKQEVPVTVLEPVDSVDAPQRFSSTDVKPDVEIAAGDEHAEHGGDENADEDDGDGFGDDFEDFEEGGQDNDFDEFEDGFQQPQPTAAATQAPPTVQPSILPFSIPDFDGLGPDEVMSTAEPCLDSVFPPGELGFPPPQTLPQESSIFLTPRSASLWSQLVAPPPLAPPDWIRSRTRRLFLVSLGVPVDLDEILPASKQKKLVLPSLNIRATSPRRSSDSRSASRLQQSEGNASSTSVDTEGKPRGSKKRKGPPPQPELDLVAARYLCMTTDEALDGMTNEELKAHVSKLEAMQGTANEILEYWKKRTDEKIGDREAFEGVIENLVKHARKVRK
ncbi:hypothetical protein J3458_004677 [Metarhizium acridum]|uniref:Uncharacterized protein n=1 Tax=Metarhizium acridum (strain CQMa 102) TaxID=655827 RepID=E9DTS3_METAQ|nr:uncharacterized protein MAC_01021 [Metarhizium acridum CQMa 102]EFY92783.1 hypothetical protein MAC_01021 [Metarhizium acridum CQMa 102]KAG8419843.1 hypothetical protein J3458_004677 [Metarhizium acridum]